MQRAIEEYLNARPEVERKELDLLSLKAIAETLENKIYAKDLLLLNPQDEDAPLHEALLSFAQQGDSPRCMALMAKSNFAQIHTKDTRGRTALNFAMEQGIAALADFENEAGLEHGHSIQKPLAAGDSLRRH